MRARRTVTCGFAPVASLYRFSLSGTRACPLPDNQALPASFHPRPASARRHEKARRSLLLRRRGGPVVSGDSDGACSVLRHGSGSRSAGPGPRRIARPCGRGRFPPVSSVLTPPSVRSPASGGEKASQRRRIFEARKELRRRASSLREALWALRGQRPAGVVRQLCR